MSVASTVEPERADRAPERPTSPRSRSPKRRTEGADENIEKASKTYATGSTDAHAIRIQREQEAAAQVPAPPSGDELYVDVLVHDVVGDLPDGWKCVEGGFELDDMLYTAYRKGEVNPRHLNIEEQQEFVEAKKQELSQYLTNLVWEFATRSEGIKAERNGRTSSARWVLTWKSQEKADRSTRF
jgi:hypothetical protein